MSRAAWLVTTMASSLAVAACGGATLGDPPKGNHATGESAEQEGSDASDPEGGARVADDGAAWAPIDAPFVVGDAGQVVAEASVFADADLYDAGEDVGWVGCYGAPPVRLERNAPARLGAQA